MRNKKSSIELKNILQQALDMYQYLTVADLEEMLLEAHIDKGVTQKVVAMVEIILKHHKPFVEKLLLKKLSSCLSLTFKEKIEN